MLLDFFKQAYPVIPTLLDQYLLRYYRLYKLNARSYYDGPVKETFPGGVGNLLMMDFLNKGLHNTISSKQSADLRDYLDTFVIEHQEELEQQYAGQDPRWRDTELNKNLVPNGFLEPYEEAMRNSLNTSNGLKRLPVNTQGEPNAIVKKLGIYEAEDGTRYDVGVVEIDGKPYLYGNNTSYPSFSEVLTYGPNEGAYIAEDYFGVKEAFLQKKAELSSKKTQLAQ